MVSVVLVLVLAVCLGILAAILGFLVVNVKTAGAVVAAMRARKVGWSVLVYDDTGAYFTVPVIGKNKKFVVRIRGGRSLTLSPPRDDQVFYSPVFGRLAILIVRDDGEAWLTRSGKTTSPISAEVVDSLVSRALLAGGSDIQRLEQLVFIILLGLGLTLLVVVFIVVKILDLSSKLGVVA